MCSVHRRSRGGPCGAGNEGGAEVVGRGQIVLVLRTIIRIWPFAQSEMGSHVGTRWGCFRLT